MGNWSCIAREFIRHPVKASAEAGRLLALSRGLARLAGAPVRPTFGRAMHLRFVRRFCLEEIGDLAMCNEPYFSTCIPNSRSRYETTKLQESLNPPRYACWLKNKAFFCRYCRALGLRMPGLFAVYYPDGPGWTDQGQMLRGAGEWEAFLADCPADGLVIKPSPGHTGDGVRAWRRRDGRFVDPGGRAYSAGQVFEQITRTGTEDCVLVQEYMYNHPDLAAMSGADGRQCVRLATLVDAGGRCHIIGAYFKVIVGNHVFDNFNYGTSGNIAVDVDPDSGVLLAAVRIEMPSRRICAVEKHPDTQRPITGVQLPHWEAACDLARRAAAAFLPVRTVCWDMILGPEGPCLIEGNIWWDPGVFNLFGRMRSMAERMEAGKTGPASNQK